MKTNLDLTEKEILTLYESYKEDIIEPSDFLEVIRRMNRIKELRSTYQAKIKRRGDGRYYIYINRKQYIAKTEIELYDKLYNMFYGIEQSTLGDLFPMWLRWKRDNTPVTGKTLKEYQNDWNGFYAGKNIIDMKLCDIKCKDVTNLFREWTKDRELTSRHFSNLKSILNGIYSYAISELEIVDANPVKSIDTRQFSLKPVDNSQDVFTEEDRKTLLGYLKAVKEPYALAICFAFQMTIRIGELKALKWKNINGNKIYVAGQRLRSIDLNDDGSFGDYHFENVDHVKGNTEKGFRYLPLNSTALSILDKMKIYQTTSEYIFLDENGKQMYTDQFNKKLKMYCEKAGVEYHSSHKIRFCVASILYKNEVPLTELQRMLGHTTIQMTLHYLRNVISESDTDEIIENALV